MVLYIRIRQNLICMVISILVVTVCLYNLVLLCISARHKIGTEGWYDTYYISPSFDPLVVAAIAMFWGMTFAFICVAMRLVGKRVLSCIWIQLLLACFVFLSACVSDSYIERLRGINALTWMHSFLSYQGRPDEFWGRHSVTVPIQQKRMDEMVVFSCPSGGNYGVIGLRNGDKVCQMLLFTGACYSYVLNNHVINPNASVLQMYFSKYGFDSDYPSREELDIVGELISALVKYSENPVGIESGHIRGGEKLIYSEDLQVIARILPETYGRISSNLPSGTEGK